MIIAITIPTENTNNSAIRVQFTHTRTAKIITIYLTIITGASLQLIAHGNTTISNMVASIRMDKTTDKIRGLMITGEIKSRNNGITTTKMINTSIMKIMNRPRIKEKVADDTIYVIGGSAASLLIGNTRMFYPAACVLVIGIMVCPVNYPAFIIPFVFAIELEIVTHGQCFNSGGNINVVSNQ